MTMPSQEAVSASTAHMVAVLCMQLVREDPALMPRLQKLARDQQVPFKADNLTPFAVEMAEAGVTAIGQRLLHHTGRMTSFSLPVPRVEDANERTAGALAVGSFTTEFVHDGPEGTLERFIEWMAAEHPDAVAGSDITKGAVADADHMLTLMAHVAGHLAGTEELEEDEQPEPRPVSDDGTRYV